MDAYPIAKRIVKTLADAGYTAYFAGGWVRDYLMGHPSEDIDIATDAPPNVILSLFPMTILVGLSFGVIVVVEEGHQFEVATFRRDVDYVDGRKPTTIELSTKEEDASRRDFTINGMFFDPLEETVHDFVGGIEDIKRRVIRTIGDPYERFVEDRLRMIRAVRFSSRFDFPIDYDTQEAITANADTLFPSVAMERVWQEFNKMAKNPRFELAILQMHRLGLLPVIFPALKGLHLDELRQMIASYHLYPQKTPTILYLMALFPQASVAEGKEICESLKTSNKDRQLAEFFIEVRKAVQLIDFDLVKWAHRYAHPDCTLALKVLSSQLSEDESVKFDKAHEEAKLKLAFHIDCIKNKKPLITADLLKQHGVVPGKWMGMLLKEAESLAILNDYRQELQVLEALRRSKLWKDHVT
jgi:poly(A) polymerase